MNDLKMNLVFEVPVSRVYNTIAYEGERWWSLFSELNDKIGEVSYFSFPKAGFFAHMKNKTLQPNKLIEWECVESKHPEETGWSDLHDWEGTEVHFMIESDGKDSSVLHFTHRGINPKKECYDSCQSGWNYYLNQSLRGYLEKGRGMPYSDNTEDNI